MALSGLDKITNRILDDARNQADKILSDARVESETINAEYETKANLLRSKMLDDAERKKDDMLSRASSSSNMNRRNAFLQFQAEEINAVFQNVEDDILQYDNLKKTELFAGLLASNLLEQISIEKTSRELYGEEDAFLPEKYEVILNQKDKNSIGDALINLTKEKLKDKVSEAHLQKLCISETFKNINGFILKYGDIESNFTYDALFRELKETYTGDVGHALFDGLL